MQVSAAILMKLVMTHIKQDVVSPGGEVNFSYIFVELLSCLLKRFRYDSIVKQKLWLRGVWFLSQRKSSKAICHWLFFIVRIQPTQ